MNTLKNAENAEGIKSDSSINSINESSKPQKLSTKIRGKLSKASTLIRERKNSIVKSSKIVRSILQLLMLLSISRSLVNISNKTDVTQTQIEGINEKVINGTVNVKLKYDYTPKTQVEKPVVEGQNTIKITRIRSK
jgi:predicted translin family RNA/ssDNA-binding protein